MREDISFWVKALRSGDYKQGFDSLNQITSIGQSFCCLGVYKEVCLKTFDPLPYNEIYTVLGFENSKDFMEANDSRCFSFNQIANMIVERYADPVA